jgi:hypothetical protein
MMTPRQAGERSIAAFLVAALAISPPLLSIFSVDVVVFGMPLLYLYLFAAWAGLLAVVAWVSDFGPSRATRRALDRPEAERSGMP